MTGRQGLNWFQGNDVDSPAEGPENWLGKRITAFGPTAAPPLAGKGERPRSQEDRSGAVFIFRVGHFGVRRASTRRTVFTGSVDILHQIDENDVDIRHYA